MKNTIATVMLLIGTMIGAGFASGREIVTYFGVSPTPLIAIVVGIFVFIMLMVFLLVGKKIGVKAVSEANEIIAGKVGGGIISVIVLLNSVVSMSAMLAGTDALFNGVYDMGRIYSVIVGIVSVVVVTIGIKGLKVASILLVPILIAVIYIVNRLSQSGISYVGLKNQDISTGFVYSAMNILLASGILTTVNELNVKQIIITSAITSIVIGILIYSFGRALTSTSAGNADMPLVELARTHGKTMYVLAVVTIALGIFTTLLTAHQTLTDFMSAIVPIRVVSAMLILTVCYLISLIGFKRVVGILYPIFGIAGALYFLISSIWLIRGFGKSRAEFFNRSNDKIHKSSERAKNHCGHHNKVKFKNLSAINDEITKSSPRNKVFAHNSSHPRKPYVNFKDRKNCRNR